MPRSALAVLARLLVEALSDPAIWDRLAKLRLRSRNHNEPMRNGLRGLNEVDRWFGPDSHLHCEVESPDFSPLTAW